MSHPRPCRLLLRAATIMNTSVIKQKSASEGLAVSGLRVIGLIAIGSVAVSLSGCGGSSTDDQALTAPLSQTGSTATLAVGSTDAGSKTKPAPKGAASLGAVTGAQFVTDTTKTAGAGYKIGGQDVLEISVFKVPELSKVVQVAESGTINLPLVGDIVAVGRTAQDVERDLSAKLGAKYLKNPQVSVYVKEFNSQRVTVEGAVKKPGVYPLKGKTTLMQVVAMSEGLDNNVASNNIALFRVAGAKRTTMRFDLEQIRSGAQQDPFLMEGDLVVVESSDGKVAFNNFTKILPVASLVKPF